MQETQQQLEYIDGRRAGRRAGPPGPPLTTTQEKVLAALVGLCPDLGTDAGLDEIAAAAGVARNGAALALVGICSRRMAVEYEGDRVWAPTFAGRSHTAPPAPEQPLAA